MEGSEDGNASSALAPTFDLCVVVSLSRLEQSHALTAASGLLHISLVIFGRIPLFWDVQHYTQYLPDWGEPGHIGEGLADYLTDATRNILPIPCHSHNDYWRRVPLLEAIRFGCTSVEADVWLFEGHEELYVGHNTASLTPNRTFTNLYVDPLVELLDKM